MITLIENLDISEIKAKAENIFHEKAAIAEERKLKEMDDDDDNDDLDIFMNSPKANTRSIRQSSTPSKSKKRPWHQNPTDDFISNTSSDENNPDQLFDSI